jgi:transposase-like protein
MARRPRWNHSPAFKAKIALDTLRGDKTLAELCEKHDLHANPALRTARAGRLGVNGNGAEIRTPIHGASSRLRGPSVRSEVGREGGQGYDSATDAPMKRAYLSISPE